MINHFFVSMATALLLADLYEARALENPEQLAQLINDVERGCYDGLGGISKHNNIHSHYLLTRLGMVCSKIETIEARRKLYDVMNKLGNDKYA